VYNGFLVFFSGFVMSTTSVSALIEIAITVIPIGVVSPVRGTIIQLLARLVCITGGLFCITATLNPPALQGMTSDTVRKVFSAKIESQKKSPIFVRDATGMVRAISPVHAQNYATG
jgi:hypothetical protein